MELDLDLADRSRREWSAQQIVDAIGQLSQIVRHEHLAPPGLSRSGHQVARRRIHGGMGGLQRDRPYYVSRAGP